MVSVIRKNLAIFANVALHALVPMFLNVPRLVLRQSTMNEEKMVFFGYINQGILHLQSGYFYNNIYSSKFNGKLRGKFSIAFNSLIWKIPCVFALVRFSSIFISPLKNSQIISHQIYSKQKHHWQKDKFIGFSSVVDFSSTTKDIVSLFKKVFSFARSV